MCIPIALVSFKQHTHLKHERSEVFELMVQIGELLKHRLCPETGQDGRVASPPTTKNVSKKQTQIKRRIFRVPLASVNNTANIVDGLRYQSKKRS